MDIRLGDADSLKCLESHMKFLGHFQTILLYSDVLSFLLTSPFSLLLDEMGVPEVLMRKIR